MRSPFFGSTTTMDFDHSTGNLVCCSILLSSLVCSFASSSPPACVASPQIPSGPGLLLCFSLSIAASTSSSRILRHAASCPSSLDDEGAMLFNSSILLLVSSLSWLSPPSLYRLLQYWVKHLSTSACVCRTSPLSFLMVVCFGCHFLFRSFISWYTLRLLCSEAFFSSSTSSHFSRSHLSLSPLAEFLTVLHSWRYVCKLSSGWSRLFIASLFWSASESVSWETQGLFVLFTFGTTSFSALSSASCAFMSSRACALFDTLTLSLVLNLHITKMWSEAISAPC